MAYEEKHWIGVNSTAGHFAMWAVRQSPYGFPDELQEAVSVFRTGLALQFGKEPEMNLGAARITKQTLYKIVYRIICAMPICRAWNTAKSNPGVEFVFTSAFTSNHPDYDIIDLDALATNVTKSTWQEHLEY